MEVACIAQPQVKDGGTKKGRYGLNYDEQAKLAAEEFAKKRQQRLLQVREQEKEIARANRQAYEARLSQKRKMLYIELLQKWDREHQQELQELQDAHQRALHAASAAQEQAEEAAEAAQRAEAAADARSAIQSDLAAKRFKEAAQHAKAERDILARERDRRIAWLQQARSAEKARTIQQVAKQQEAQRLAAEEARERLRRRGRDSVYDFRFTRFHETGLEQPAALDLGSGIPSLADTAELQARRAAKEAERKRAAEERGQEALHKLRMERAAKQLTAQLEAELQARRSAAASAVAESPLVAAAQPPREVEKMHWQGAEERDHCERRFAGTGPSLAALQPTLAPDFAALPRATWPQPTPWRTHALSSAQQLQEAVGGKQETGKCQETGSGHVPAAAAARMRDAEDMAAGRADKTTQCPEGVDRQTQTESPEPRRQPACRVPRPQQLTQRPVSSNFHQRPVSSNLHQRSQYPVSASPAASPVAAERPALAPAAHDVLKEAAAVAPAGQQDEAGAPSLAEEPTALPAGVAVGDMVRTLPGELSDSCCSSRAGSVTGFTVRPLSQPIRANRARAQGVPVQAAGAQCPGTAGAEEAAPDAQLHGSCGSLGPMRPGVGPTPDLARERESAAEKQAFMTASGEADASCTITLAGRVGGLSGDGRAAADKKARELADDGAQIGEGLANDASRLDAQPELNQQTGADIPGAFLAQAAAELEALCAASLEHAPADMPTSKPSKRTHAKHGPPATSTAPEILVPQGRPVKTALQRAEELLARLTEDAGLWDMPLLSTGPPKPSPKQQTSAELVGGTSVSMQFNIEDEQRLIMELEAISKQSGYSLPSYKTYSAAPHQERSGEVAGGRVNSANFGAQARHKGGMNSLEVLAERLQDAISDTVSMTEGMLGNNPLASLPASASSANATLSHAESTKDTAAKEARSKGSGSSLYAASSLAGTNAAAEGKGHLGSRGSVASSSCSSLLGALRLASIAEERSPGRDQGLDADGGDIFSCSDDDAASDASGLPFDAISLGTTESGSPLAGGMDNGWLSDIESLEADA